MQFLRNLIFPGGFMPHGYCYLWTPSLIGLRVASDSLIALSYFSIPLTLLHITRKQRGIPFSWMLLCFGAFIVACGSTHLLEVWTIWFPSYWLAGGVKAVTAAVSVATALVLIAVTPRALAMPGIDWLIEINQRLSNEVEQRAKAESSLRRVSEDLELRIKQRTAQLEDANRDLESLTYSVSHDLRAPLRQVDGFSRILVDEYGAQLPPGALNHIDHVRKATAHMGHLVDDLLNLARVGRGALKVAPTDLNRLVAETISGLDADTNSRTVDWRIGPLSPVECDRGLMRQVLSNLLANALKFTRSRDSAIIEIGETQSDGGTEILVRDNGVGFDMKYADKLFQIFQRLHREEEFEGTGVGLAIVHRILQKHGGTIRAESSPGNGATFFFTLGLPSAAHAVPTAVLKAAK
ncbi:MAG TPA: ATP-binding protein [Candidatus Sulfotelmatobacter sp.]|jgi:signal transduction histidine kinase|nr:ATP-binding protein [Candidatus Sulfotelmatobacter sp.]